MARVGLIFGGRSTEHRVSVKSARTIAEGLAEAGHEVVPLAIAEDGSWADAEVSRGALDGASAAVAATGSTARETLHHLLDSSAEVLFPIVHGTWGEDGALQGLAEMLDLPYVGAGVTPSALAMDKALAKHQLEAAGIPVVEYRSFRRERFAAEREACLAEAAELGTILFVKPSVGGSSVGVVKVDGPEALPAALEHAFSFDDAVLVERAVAGRELECAVLGYRELAASAIGEIVPSREFYDYEDKYLADDAGLIAPAELFASVADRLREAAVRAFRAVGGWGMARVDFLLEGDVPYVNEINTLPGFTRISMYPRLWGISGLPLAALCDRLVTIAFERHEDRHRLDAGIRDWLARHG